MKLREMDEGTFVAKGDKVPKSPSLRASSVNLEKVLWLEVVTENV